MINIHLILIYIYIYIIYVSARVEHDKNHEPAKAPGGRDGGAVAIPGVCVFKP